MIERRIVEKVGDNMVIFKSSSESAIVFAASLVWPMVDSYYVTLLFTLSMIKNKGVEASQINKRV